MTQLLTTEEAAVRLGLKPSTLMNWRSLKRYALKYIRVGGRIKYRETDVEQFLQARTMPGIPEPAKRRGRAA